jgi:hypothetical protein
MKRKRNEDEERVEHGMRLRSHKKVAQERLELEQHHQLTSLFKGKRCYHV